MAVLTGELSISQAMPLTGIVNLQSFSSVAAGAANHSLLLSNGLSSASAGFFLQTSLRAIALVIVSQGNYYNYLSSLARFFGINVRQTTTHLIIQKSDFTTLSAKANNTAESLLIALLLQVKQFESNSLISRVVIDLFKQEIITNNNQNFINSIFLFNLYVKVAYVNNPNLALANQIINSTPINPNQF